MIIMSTVSPFSFEIVFYSNVLLYDTIILASFITRKKQKPMYHSWKNKIKKRWGGEVGNRGIGGIGGQIANCDVMTYLEGIIIVSLVFTALLYNFYATLILFYLYKCLQVKWKTNLLWSLLSFLVQSFFAYLIIRLVKAVFEPISGLFNLWSWLCFYLKWEANIRKMRQRLSEDVTNFVNKSGPVDLSDFNPDKFNHIIWNIKRRLLKIGTGLGVLMAR